MEQMISHCYDISLLGVAKDFGCRSISLFASACMHFLLEWLHELNLANSLPQGISFFLQDTKLSKMLVEYSHHKSSQVTGNADWYIYPVHWCSTIIEMCLIMHIFILATECLLLL